MTAIDELEILQLADLKNSSQRSASAEDNRTICYKPVDESNHAIANTDQIDAIGPSSVAVQPFVAHTPNPPRIERSTETTLESSPPENDSCSFDFSATIDLERSMKGAKDGNNDEAEQEQSETPSCPLQKALCTNRVADQLKGLFNACESYIVQPLLITERCLAVGKLTSYSSSNPGCYSSETLRVASFRGIHRVDPLLSLSHNNLNVPFSTMSTLGFYFDRTRSVVCCAFCSASFDLVASVVLLVKTTTASVNFLRLSAEIVARLETLHAADCRKFVTRPIGHLNSRQQDVSAQRTVQARPRTGLARTCTLLLERHMQKALALSGLHLPLTVDPRGYKMYYFMQTSQPTNDFDAAMARRRTVEYKRFLNLQLDIEAVQYRSEWQRFRSFLDNPCTAEAQPQNSLWRRSLQLAYYLTKLGFYYCPRSQQHFSATSDAIRCAFCRRQHRNWWPSSWHYPETVYSMQHRVCDLTIVLALFRLHKLNCTMCPMVLDFRADQVACSADEQREINRILMSKVRVNGLVTHRVDPPRTAVDVDIQPSAHFAAWLAAERDTLLQSCDADACDVEARLEASFECEPRAVWRPSESDWSRRTGVTTPMQFQPNAASERVLLLLPDFQHPRFVTNEMRLLTFTIAGEDGQAQDDIFYVYECLRECGFASSQFSAWPSEKPSPETLAAAGFFATLSGDQTVCFACGERRSDWHQSDDPFIEHARVSPRCVFLLHTRGLQFVTSVTELCDSSVSWHRTYSLPVGFMPMIMHRVDACGVRVSMDRRIFRKLVADFCMCQNQTVLLRHVINAQMLRTGDDFASYVAMLEAQRDALCRLRQLRASDSVHFLRLYDEEVDQLNRGVHVSQQRATTTTAPQPQPQPLDAHGEADSGSIEARFTCVVCLSNRLEVAFIPCGHLSACYSCASQLTDCPMCRAFIRGTVRVYF